MYDQYSKHVHLGQGWQRPFSAPAGVRCRKGGHASRYEWAQQGTYIRHSTNGWWSVSGKRLAVGARRSQRMTSFVSLGNYVSCLLRVVAALGLSLATVDTESRLRGGGDPMATDAGGEGPSGCNIRYEQVRGSRFDDRVVDAIAPPCRHPNSVHGPCPSAAQATKGCTHMPMVVHPHTLWCHSQVATSTSCMLHTEPKAQ